MQQTSSDTRFLCENILDKSLTDPLVLYLLTCLKKGGCPLSRADIKCGVISDEETNRTSGSFDIRKGIVINENCIDSSIQLTDTLRHELIHALDHCRVEFADSEPDKWACSEIRAASLSGECKWSREFMRGNAGLQNIRNLFRDCVRRRSILSLTPNLSDNVATELVDKYMDVCISDTTPFIDIP